MFLLSYRTKHVSLVLILQSYYHIFIELKNIDRNLVELTWIWEITPCIMCVQYIGGCSVHRGVFSTSGGCHEYIGGIS